MNFFQPSFKLRDKTRVGAKVTRRCYRPATPCERLLAHPAVCEETKAQLRQCRAELDPVKLIQQLREAQAELAQLTTGSGDTIEASGAGASMESFLALLPELWRLGEVRPTHRRRSKKPRSWRTRADPFEEVWPEARGWLEQEPDITGKALFERIREQHPGEFAPGQLRTLQRRVREWRQAMARRLLMISTAPSEADPIQKK